MREAWIQKWKNWTRQLPLPALLVLAAGCVLLLLPRGTGEGEIPVERVGEDQFDLAVFQGQLEQLLSRIEGAGETRVLLSLDSGTRQILAQDRSQSTGGAQLETVTVNRGGGEQEVIALQRVLPSFRGAVVVCPGGGDPAVRLALTDAVSVLTGLGADRIRVCRGTGS